MLDDVERLQKRVVVLERSNGEVAAQLEALLLRVEPHLRWGADSDYEADDIERETLWSELSALAAALKGEQPT